MRIYFLVPLLALCGTLGAESVYAQTGLTIQPVSISHTMSAGQSVEGEITLINESDSSIEVETAVEDFIPTAGTDDVAFVGRAEGNTTVRDWITLDIPETFTFAKGERRTISYTITAPSNPEPGSHFGVAFFKAAGADENETLKVGTRVGTLFYVTIPGNFLQKGRILDFSGPRFVEKGPVPFTIKFENTGTVHFEPKGTITVRNIFGTVVGEVPIEGQAVLPTGVRDLKASWHVESVLLGKYEASLRIVDGEGNELSAESLTFYAFPVQYALYFLLVVILFFVLIRIFRRFVHIEFRRK
jgi:hypothetical protein